MATVTRTEAFAAGIADGMTAQQMAVSSAAAQGHHLGSWSPYGIGSMKAKCVNCGAEARVPYSAAQDSYQPPTGMAVYASAGTCAAQAHRHPNRKRGTFD